MLLFYWICKATLCAWTIPLTLSPSVRITENCPITPSFKLAVGYFLRYSSKIWLQKQYLLPTPHICCCNICLSLCPASPHTRAKRLPQHGGPISEQHPVGSGLHQTEKPPAVCALLPQSSPLRPQCRTTPEECDAAAGWVSITTDGHDSTPC